MSFKPRRIIAQLPTVAHGGFIYREFAELGLKPADIIDFSVSTNPFMPPPEIREIVAKAAIDRYPDSNSTELTLKLSGKLRITPESIVVASGTTELIRAVTAACIRTRDKVAVIEPTYGEYEPAVRLAGGRLIHIRSNEEKLFVPDIDTIANIMQTQQPRVVFICNPNNPTGVLLSRNDIERIVESLGDTLLVLDEAYMTFIEAGWSSLDLTKRANVVVMRSMTKDYGLPGLRLGYAVTHPDIAGCLRKVLPPWNVNAAAQAAGLAVLDMDNYLEETITRMRESKDYLVNELTSMGFQILPSAANYFIMKTGQATQFRRLLLEQGVMVRDCTSFGLPDYVRIAVQSMHECQRLISAVRTIKRNQP